MGTPSAPFPKSVGGGGLSCEECISLIIELAAAAPSTALVACMPMGLAAGAAAAAAACILLDHRAKAQDLLERVVADFSKQRLYAGVQLGARRCWCAFCDEDRRRRDANGQFRITGEKILAVRRQKRRHVLLGVLVSQTDLPGAAAVEFFLIDSSSPGVHVQSDWNGLGMRSTESHTVHYEDAPARRDPRLSEARRNRPTVGLLVLSVCGDPARLRTRHPAGDVDARADLASRALAPRRGPDARPGGTSLSPGNGPRLGARQLRSLAVACGPYQDLRRGGDDPPLRRAVRVERRSPLPALQPRAACLMEASYRSTALRPPLPLALDMMVDGFASLGPTDI